MGDCASELLDTIIVEEFTMETVMSDARKLDYFKLAKSLGYRLYVYFVSTKDPEIKFVIGHISLIIVMNIGNLWQNMMRNQVI